jgi:hypothetical protein
MSFFSKKSSKTNKGDFNKDPLLRQAFLNNIKRLGITEEQAIEAMNKDRTSSKKISKKKSSK